MPVNSDQNASRPDILINDPTLRDGNHAIQHCISADQIAAYCAAVDAAGVPIVEVGHGNGLAASSLQLGFSTLTDAEMLRVARDHLSRAKLGVFMIAGVATANRDLQPALDMGVDVVRVACHCTEADTTERHLGFARDRGAHAYASLMMAHMAPPEQLVGECAKLYDYGAQGIVLMDSAGAMLPDQVARAIHILSAAVPIPVGFHAHNNLGLAIANSLAAARAGARILDGTSRGFGAGAGNASLEVLVAVLDRCGFSTGIDMYKLWDASDVAEQLLLETLPFPRPLNIVSGLAGVISTMSKHVVRISSQHRVDPRDVFLELGRRRAVGGQEDLIVDVAFELAAAQRCPESKAGPHDQVDVTSSAMVDIGQ